MSIELKHNENYSALVFRVETLLPHPNADRLQCIQVAGNNVITDMSTQVGDIYIYFPLECSINKDFIKHINGFENASLNEDVTVKGFFNKQARVRAIRLRGSRSEGYALPAEKVLDFFKYRGSYSDLVGKSFDTINDVTVCKKYVAPVKGASTPNNKKSKEESKSRLVKDQFRLHDDTANARRNTKVFKLDDRISVSYKMHGTNSTIANVLCKQPKGLWLRLKTWFTGKEEGYLDYDLVWGSRRVVKNATYRSVKNIAHYYDTDIWGIMAQRVKDHVEKGITLYSEIVGYTPDGKAIQKNYDYGMGPNEMALYVFKITYTTPEGRVVEFSPKQMVAYCQKHNLRHTPQLFEGTVAEYLGTTKDTCGFPEKVGDLLVAKLEKEFVGGKCNMCVNDVPAEGIVIKHYPEAGGNDFFEPEIKAYKLKSFEFLLKETEMLDKGEVGMEEQEEAENVSAG